MKIDYLFLIVSQITRIVFGGLPLSDPFSDKIDGKIMPYNLIDTDPSCWYEGICPMFPPGGELSVFPNNEEKYQQLLHNVHRMHTNCSLMLPIAKYKYGGNTNGGYLSYCSQGCKYCGNADTSGRDPLYWYSDANQMARFKQWDEKNCNQNWYNEQGVTAHFTCKWGNTNRQYWGKGITSSVPQDRCAVLADRTSACEFGVRASAFCHDDKDRCWFETEGICGGNSCLWDPHCEPVFAAKYDYVGKGFVGDMNGVAAVYSRFTKEIWYLLPIAAHFDERIVIAQQDQNTDGKYFNLMLEYHDPNKTQTPVNCYALYKNDYHDLRVYVSETGLKCPLPQYETIPEESVWLSWFTRHHYSVIFYEQFVPHLSCEPYSFICKTSLDNKFRLPEENDYYFGTSWIDWYWSDYAGMGYDACHEQHYYNHPNEGWTANGGPTLTKSDIWYYNPSQNTEYSTCHGCDKIEVLKCLENCILSDDLSAQCKSACQSGATPAPIVITPEPTNNPTRKPIVRPTNSPTQKPTNNPTQKPTSNPTQKPTRNPTRKPTTTQQPTKTPTQKPTGYPTKNPIQSPTKTPTQKPSESPTTKNPTESPVPAPTIFPTINTPEPSRNPSENPTETPTIATTRDNDNTCNTEIDWFYKWGRIGSWNEDKEEQLGPLYKSVAEEKFIEDNPHCGEFNIDDGFEYYYYFFWGGRSQPNKKKLFIYMHVCCGIGRTFGQNYHMPDAYENNENYHASAAWNRKYGASGALEDGEHEWTNVNNFGVKQYIVFTICGLLIIGCCLAGIFGFKYYKKKKIIREGNTSTSPRNKFGRKSRGSKKNLAKTIQMHGLSSFPGPKHVQLPSYGRDSTDGTDGNNTYLTSMHGVIPNNESSDGSSVGNINANNTLAPPMMKMGHQKMPSRSVDSLDVADMNTIGGVGLPPPVPQDVQDTINQLDTQDIADAFEVDI